MSYASTRGGVGRSALVAVGCVITLALPSCASGSTDEPAAEAGADSVGSADVTGSMGDAPAASGSQPAVAPSVDAPDRDGAAATARDEGSARHDDATFDPGASRAAARDRLAARAEMARIAEERRQAEARQAERERIARITSVQQRLQELGFLVGAADGVAGQQTQAAVMAFQAVNGLQVDGVVGPQTEAALDAPPSTPQLRGGPPTRIEVDLSRQVLHLVEGGTRTTTMKVSSGNGEPYSWSDGTPAVGNTPVGTFTIQRRIRGVRESSLGLGTLYDPMYFHLGYAIHGSNHVPAGPASHGCVRLSRADAVWLFDRVPDGTPVVLHGGTHTFEA